MYGKHFESMYEGSMYGAGIAVFAVWGYVIAHTKNSRVEINPRVLANTLGATAKEIEGALAVLMAPDAESRHKEHDGRRLLREGQFQYLVPSWSVYQQIRNEAERREYNRLKQAEHRAKNRSNGTTVRPEHRDDGGRVKKQAKKRNTRQDIYNPRGTMNPRPPLEEVNGHGEF